MARLFPDHPEALESTVRIAEMCDFTLKGAGSLPAFDVPPGFTIDFTAVGVQAGDGNLSLTSAGVKGPAGKW